jgi:hypothetical protein
MTFFVFVSNTKRAASKQKEEDDKAIIIRIEYV